MLTYKIHKQPSIIENVIDRDSCIQVLFEKQVAATPDKIAVIANSSVITYRDLDQQSSAFAGYLERHCGAKPKDIIAIHIQNSIELIIAVMGVLKAGATYVPLDSSYPLERKIYMVNNAGAKCLISSAQESLNVPNVPSISFEMNMTSVAVDFTRPNYSLQDVLYILYTSGSTGRPKGVPLRQAGIMNMLHWYCSDFQINDRDTNFIFSSFAYDLTQKNIFSSLISGATIVFYDGVGYQPHLIIRFLEKYKVTIINSTPSAFYPLLEFVENVQQLRSLRWVFLGGEKIHCQRIHPIAALYPSTKIVNTYGPTECSDVVCSYVLTKEDVLTNENVPLGKPIAQAGVLVLDENLNIITDEQHGEVYLYGICVGGGYINQPELTQQRFIKNLPAHLTSLGIHVLYRVGDVVHWDKNGNLYFIGRVDDQVKLRGNRIELSEIDFVIQQEKEVRQSVTVMIEKNQRQFLVSFYLSSKSIDNEALKERIGHFLPKHMLPNKLVCLEAFPLTPNAKVDKGALKNIAQGFF